MANPSFGDTVRNVTPQNFSTHPTSRQHSAHLMNFFISNFISKDYQSHVKFETSIGFTQ